MRPRQQLDLLSHYLEEEPADFGLEGELASFLRMLD
jgi:hypothetical protein